MAWMRKISMGTRSNGTNIHREKERTLSPLLSSRLSHKKTANNSLHTTYETQINESYYDGNSQKKNTCTTNIHEWMANSIYYSMKFFFLLFFYVSHENEVHTQINPSLLVKAIFSSFLFSFLPHVGTIHKSKSFNYKFA